MRPGTPGFVASRLREAREARGLTIVGLSELIGVSKQVVSKYESGERTPGPDVLIRLAAVLQVPTGFFTLEPRPENGEAIFYRSLAAATKGARLRGERRMDWLADIVGFLGQYVAFPEVSIPELPSADPEEAASAVRAAWGLGAAPIANVVWLLEAHGAVVTRGYIDAHTIDAFSRWDHIGRPLIFLAADKGSAVRSRFDAAHELGHMVLHRRVPRREFYRADAFKAIEHEAHEFASAFLLPPRAFMADLWNPGLDSMRAIKPKWEVSIAAMISRSKSIGIITDADAQRLRILAARRGWSRSEPLDDQLAPEEPRFLRRAFEMIVDRGVVARDAITDGLTLGPADIESLANLSDGFLRTSEAPISLLDRRMPTLATDDGVRGSIVPFAPRGPSASEPPRPSGQSKNDGPA